MTETELLDLWRRGMGYYQTKGQPMTDTVGRITFEGEITGIPTEITRLERENAALREALETLHDPETHTANCLVCAVLNPPHQTGKSAHVCGLIGFDPMKGDRCGPCDVNNQRTEP